MNYFRNLHKDYIFICLVAFGLLVRTLIPAGFMLDTQADDGSSITVTICHGPNNSDQLPELDQHNNNQPESSGRKEGTHCNLWTSSVATLDLQLLEFNFANKFFNEEINLYNFILNTSRYNLTQFARAPPTLI